MSPAAKAATYTGQCDQAKCCAPASTITRTGPIVYHESANGIGSIDSGTRPDRWSGSRRAIFAPTATNGTSGVGSRKSAGTNTSIVGYVQADATGNFTLSTTTQTASTRIRFSSENAGCHAAIAAMT